MKVKIKHQREWIASLEGYEKAYRDLDAPLEALKVGEQILEAQHLIRTMELQMARMSTQCPTFPTRHGDSTSYRGVTHGDIRDAFQGYRDGRVPLGDLQHYVHRIFEALLDIPGRPLVD